MLKSQTNEIAVSVTDYRRYTISYVIKISKNKTFYINIKRIWTFLYTPYRERDFPKYLHIITLKHCRGKDAVFLAIFKVLQQEETQRIYSTTLFGKQTFQKNILVLKSNKN